MKRILNVSLAVIATFLLIVSCKNNSTNPTNTTATVTGHWIGTGNVSGLITVKLDLNLTEAAGIIGGSGTATYTPIIGSGSTVTIPAVAGTFSNPDVYLTAVAITYNGKLSSDQKSIVGTLKTSSSLMGADTTSLAMTLNKQ